MPRQGQSVESCILTEWKVKVGDEVSEGDVLAVIETDKASFDLESTASGTILELFWESDDDVPVLANVAAVGKEGEDASEFRPADSGSSAAESDATPSQDPAPVSTVEAQPAAASTAPSESPVPASASSGVSPRARKLASNRGVDAETIVGSGPGGRVIERDVEAFLAGRPRLSVSARSKAMDGLGYLFYRWDKYCCRCCARRPTIKCYNFTCIQCSKNDGRQQLCAYAVSL